MHVTMMLIVTLNNISLLVMLIISWLTMGDYRQVFFIINLFKSYCSSFMVRIYGKSILLVLINAANPGI